MEQRSDAWHSARLGCVTASRISDVMAKIKGGKPAAVRENYAAQLVAERLTGERTDFFVSSAMQHGIDNEDRARALYELHGGHTVAEEGFVPHPTIEMSGASPDGLVGDDGLVEIKCPNTATHIATLRGASIDRKYLLQMQWQMKCCDRQWCDFVSFDPRLPLDMQLHVRRVERDDDLLAEIEAEVTAFLAEVSEAVEDLENTYSKKEAA